ncbi:MAG: RagB/SusD family nutrient uptake outer membrane protein [Bacteroidales bacterium]|nr:RagB/SusD family nutrient uptake outer membrane protein [Bacteroidales bacterium]
MKRINIKAYIVATLMTFSFLSCEDILEETPRSTFTSAFFQTEIGVSGGLTALYSHLRYIYGEAYYFNSCLTGTDEATYGQSADLNFKQMDYTGQGDLTSTNHPTEVPWKAAFPMINTASGIIENASVAGLSDELIAEARFFRAFDYFLLVTTYGGVPLDLGAGNLVFNSAPIRSSVRNTVPEVYTIGIFPDLRQAAIDAPDQARVHGGVTKTLAKLYLAKAYLTYAWWLENPNNIPTYPESSRVDPDGHDAAWYFQQAYDVAVEAIDNPGTNFNGETYGLQPTYYDVNLAQNDRNSEILLWADHTQESELYNGGSLTYGTGGAPDNFAVWMLTWNYTEITSSSASDSWKTVSSVQREAEQHLGRPWTRMAPPIEVVTNTFADKTNDSRYDGTFTTVYRANYQKADPPVEAPVYNANYMEVYPGDAVLTFLDEEPATAIDYSNSPYNSGVGAGVLPGRADFVVSPEGISRIMFPGLYKLGTYRTDHTEGYGEPNAGLTRPFNIAKFSELYFIAAEAAVKGATVQAGKSARELINMLRARAGVWRWDNNGNVEKIEDHSADMVAATPATIDIDYILAERSREYFGEGYRWYDLIRTQKWTEYASSYTICGSAKGDHTPVTYEREIEPFHYLRPIPQDQLDGMEMTPEEIAAYQNPGY